MNAYNYIIEKQMEWAKNNNIDLVDDKGKKPYTKELTQNLFEPIKDETIEYFKNADGNELNDDEESNKPAKMKALHSSSAMVVNIFQYWLDDPQTIANILVPNLSQIGDEIKLNFEQKFPINNIKSNKYPNIDVVIENKNSSSKNKRYLAIECKFTEQYNKTNNNLSSQYYKLSREDTPNLIKLVKKLYNRQDKIIHLDAAQLIKHILGLLSKTSKDNFILFYFYFDVCSEKGKKHKNEIEKFSKVTYEDGIDFRSMSVQELIKKLCEELSPKHSKYLNYLKERYFFF